MDDSYTETLTFVPGLYAQYVFITELWNKKRTPLTNPVEFLEVLSTQGLSAQKIN